MSAAANFAAVLILGSGCTVPAPPPMVGSNPPALQAPPATGPYRALARDLAAIAPDSALLAVAPSPGVPPEPVLRLRLPERVLFAFDSDQPNESSGPVLATLAAEILHDTPQAQVTILGHTDALGSGSYNIALSRRRGEAVARLLEQRGIQPGQLSIVPIGMRQPIASNETPDGRARNRRVEFLISPELAANRQAVLAGPSAPALAGLPPPEPERLPALAFAPLGPGPEAAIAEPLPGSPGRKAAAPPQTRGMQRAAYPATAGAAVQPATPQPAPHYDLRAPAPEVPLNPLGSSKPY